jgi:hypothetical protein
MKTEVHLEIVVDSEEDTVQELFATAARIKTMPARPTIERSSISPGWWWLTIPKAFSNLLGLRRRYLYLDECY